MGKPGRPKGSDNKEKICSLRLDEQTLKRLNAYCERLKVAKSEAVSYTHLYGRGSFLVTGIGMETEVGKIATLLKTTSEKRTPLQINLDQFGQKLSIIILIFCGILFGINVFRGDSIGDAFLFAVALAVAAIPEAVSYTHLDVYKRQGG